MSTPDIPEEAIARKNEGNKLFKEGHFLEAVEEYSAAIEVHATAVFFGNRAAAHLKLENYGSAEADADKAIELDSAYAKAYYRKGSALLAMGKHKAARGVFRNVVKMQPTSRDARAKLAECQKIIKQEAFQAAIESDRGSGGFDTENVDDMVVPDSYKGPRWDEGPLKPELVKEMAAWMKDQKLLHRKYAVKIFQSALSILTALPSLVEVSRAPGATFNVCGDTHGQYYDTMNIFETYGWPSEDNSYLFNGDFVDRGSFGVENVLLLLAWKVALPQHMHLTRGNHESLNMNKMYGYEGEVEAKYDAKVFALCTQVFNALPAAAVVDSLHQKVFVTHGGIPAERPETKLDEIRSIQRHKQPDTGLLCDLLWSDPQPFAGKGPSKRGVGFSFGPDLTKQFLGANGLDLLIRSHEMKPGGFIVEHDGKCITVFSAPNYCDQMGNMGGIAIFNDDTKDGPDLQKFSHVKHPPVRPMAYAKNLSMFGL
jgi:serine/threonine-protein phosphatase 5